MHCHYLSVLIAFMNIWPIFMQHTLIMMHALLITHFGKLNSPVKYIYISCRIEKYG